MVTTKEKDLCFEEFASDMTEPSEQEEAFFEVRRKLGRGVGLSDTGDLIYQGPKEV